MPNIVFYFPYPRVGGVSVLFLRLSKKLQHSAIIYLMDLPDGYMACNLPPGCQFIPYDKPELIPSDAIVVFQSVPFWRLRNIEKFPRKAKVLFWNLHPYNLNPSLIQIGSRLLKSRIFAVLNNIFSTLRFRRLKRFAVSLESGNALVFMDEENRSKTSTVLDHEFSKRYLPITTEEEPKVRVWRRPTNPGRKLKVAWLGRLEGFKIPILLHTLNRLNEVKSFEIECDVIGDGIDKNLVEATAATLNRLEVQLKGEVNFKELDEALSSQNLVFAMGTSALDSARLGIPTVLLDYSYSEIKGNYRFRLLRYASGFNVAEEITEKHIEKVSSLEMVLKDVVDNYERESDLTYDYWLNNHSPDWVSSMFLERAAEANVTFGELINGHFHEPDIFTKLICFFDSRKRDGSGFIRR